MKSPDYSVFYMKFMNFDNEKNVNNKKNTHKL